MLFRLKSIEREQLLELTRDRALQLKLNELTLIHFWNLIDT